MGQALKLSCCQIILLSEHLALSLRVQLNPSECNDNEDDVDDAAVDFRWSL